MPGTFVDPRGPGAVLASKGNILPQLDYGHPAALLGETPEVYAGGTDAATGASSVVTADTVPITGAALSGDSGALAAGEYLVYCTVVHPSAAAANREVNIQLRDAANAATRETLATFAAGSGKRTLQTKVRLSTNERIRLLTGTDATNVNIAFVLLIKKLD